MVRVTIRLASALLSRPGPRKVKVLVRAHVYQVDLGSLLGRAQHTAKQIRRQLPLHVVLFFLGLFLQLPLHLPLDNSSSHVILLEVLLELQILLDAFHLALVVKHSAHFFIVIDASVEEFGFEGAKSRTLEHSLRPRSLAHRAKVDASVS